MPASLQAQSISCGILDHTPIAGEGPLSRQFGVKVAAEDGVVVASDYTNNRMHVYRQYKGELILEQIIPAPASAPSFGAWIVVDQGKIFSYSPYAVPVGSAPGSNRGAVFVYEHDGLSWILSHRIDLPPTTNTYYNECCHDLDVDGEHLIVIREHYMLFFRYMNGEWRHIQSRVSWNGDSDKSVSIEHHRAATTRQTTGPSAITTAEIWEFDGQGWSVGSSFDYSFAASIRLELSWPHLLSWSRSGSGVALYQQLPSGQWVPRNSHGQTFTRGFSNGKFFGAQFDMPYLYVSSADNSELVILEHITTLPSRWVVVERVSGQDLGVSRLGSSLAVSNQHVFVGNDGAAGRIDSLEYGCRACPADLDQDHAYTPNDITLFLLAYQFGAPLADLDQNGILNFFDIAQFLGYYASGCP